MDEAGKLKPPRRRRRRRRARIKLEPKGAMQTDSVTQRPKSPAELLFAFIDSIPDAEERVKTAALESALSFVWRAWGWNPERWQEERQKARSSTP